jgi:hypothetical protein
MGKLEYHREQGQSRQYELLMDLWKDEQQQKTIRQNILVQLHEPTPDCCLKDEPYFYHDGLWDVLPQESYYISRYIPENGNEDDECQLLIAIWCLAMAESGHPDSLVHIAHFMKVEIEGY